MWQTLQQYRNTHCNTHCNTGRCDMPQAYYHAFMCDMTPSYAHSFICDMTHSYARTFMCDMTHSYALSFICDMTHSYVRAHELSPLTRTVTVKPICAHIHVRHDSFICALIQMRHDAFICDNRYDCPLTRYLQSPYVRTFIYVK